MFEELPGFLSEFVKAEGGTSRGKVGVEVVKTTAKLWAQTSKAKASSIFRKQIVKRSH